MNRRHFIRFSTTSIVFLGISGHTILRADHGSIKKIKLSREEWRQRLTPDQFSILRDAGTEYPYSSKLNHEKRPGTYHCAGCHLPLFSSKAKYDSGTGWPSFFEAIPGHTETKIDFKLIYPRTEYHCARCGGHQGHLFDDGPDPTGQRWCNNGLALTFVSQSGASQESADS